MFILMVVVFVLGYIAIALEHPLKVDKAASALVLGVLVWTIYILAVPSILGLGHSTAWEEFLHGSLLTDYLKKFPDATLIEQMKYFVVDNQIIEHLGDISEILFFLLGAMTIVETIDQHRGFKIITDKITTTNKVKLLWIMGVLTFFMSALLDNLTTTIVMVALLRKLIADKKSRWFFASMIVVAANAGGAWSPIGDVTTIMLWIGKQVTAGNIIAKVIVPSIFNMLFPLIIVSLYMKGEVQRPKLSEADQANFTTPFEQKLMLAMGVGALLFVPIFKTLTHLPPYMGMLFGLGVLWITTEIMHRNKKYEDKRKLSIVGILQRVDVPTILFFLGILSAVAALQSAGHLHLLAGFLDKHIHNIYGINTAIGILSAIVDNVPLTAGAMGMYPVVTDAMVQASIEPEYMSHFVQDGAFWELLAYAAGTGGSMLIIGSAAGVAAMGLEKIDFIWYMKKITWLAFIGYIGGIGIYWLQELLISRM
ncbi:MAG: sodium:proton antiporter [Draconibacterium sp.]|nr:MAG: sodium:proton antiporter [Draconibacterium sp.]PIF05940.1 MAG: sodium:proton antiporter [Draconibacterium sp.]